MCIFGLCLKKQRSQCGNVVVSNVVFKDDLSITGIFTFDFIVCERGNDKRSLKTDRAI